MAALDGRTRAPRTAPAASRRSSRPTRPTRAPRSAASRRSRRSPRAAVTATRAARRRCARRRRPSSASGRPSSISNVSWRVVLDRLDLEPHDRDTLAGLHDRPAERRERHVPAARKVSAQRGSSRSRASDSRRSDRANTSSAAHAGRRSRPGSRAAHPRPVDSTATVPSGHAGSSSSAPPRATSFSSRRLACSSWSSVDLSTDVGADLAVEPPVDRAVRLAGPARDRPTRACALRPQPLAASRTRSPARPAPPPRGRRRERGQAGERPAAPARRRAAARRRAGSSAAPLRRGGRTTTGRGTPRRPRPARRARRPARPPARGPARGCAPPRSATASCFSRGSDGRKTCDICSFGAGVRRMKRPITWRKNSSVRAVVAYTPTRRRGTSTPSETISTETSQGAEPAEKRAIRADASAASECTMSGRSPVIRASRSASLSACSLSIATTSPPASGWSPARISRSCSSASRRTWVIQSPSGSSAVRSRRAASAAGQHDVEVGAAHLPVAHPLHVAAVGVERHRPADAVDQRLRVAVAVVRAGDAVVVVGHPRDRRVVRAERRARQQQPEAGARERLDRRAAPRGVLAHVVRLVGDQQRRPLRAAAPVHPGARRHRRVGDRDAVPVARLRPRGVRPVRLERGCRSAPRPAPTGGRCASSARRRPRATRAPRRASGGPRAGRTWSCRRRASRTPGTPRRHGRRRRPQRPAATRAAVGAVGQDGRERPTAGRGGASISYVTGGGTL